MADRGTTLHKFSEFRTPSAHANSLSETTHPTQQKPLQGSSKKKVDQGSSKKEGLDAFFTTNSDLAILCFKTLESNTNRAVSEYIFGFQALAHAFTESLSSPEANLWMASFTRLNICCGVLSLTRIEQICFLLHPHRSLMAQALC